MGNEGPDCRSCQLKDVMGIRTRKKWGCRKMRQRPWYITENLAFRTSPQSGVVHGYVCPNVMLRAFNWLGVIMAALPVWMNHHMLPFEGSLWDQPNVIGSGLILAENEAIRCRNKRLEQQANTPPKGGK